MQLKLFLALILTALFVCATRPALAQVAPAGGRLGLPLTVGVGFSSFEPDWVPGRMQGGSLWIDYTPRRVPKILQGIGVEVEGRDISLNVKASGLAIVREDSAGGGVIYTWSHFRNLHPFGKYLIGFGNADYRTSAAARHHDSRTVTMTGGGLEVHAFRHLWARADYEYQFWPDFFKSTTPHGTLNPYGITVGASYHFSGARTTFR